MQINKDPGSQKLDKFFLKLKWPFSRIQNASSSKDTLNKTECKNLPTERKVSMKHMSDWDSVETGNGKSRLRDIKMAKILRALSKKEANSRCKSVEHFVVSGKVIKTSVRYNHTTQIR